MHRIKRDNLKSQVVHNNVHPHTNGGSSHTCDLLNAPNGIDDEDYEDEDGNDDADGNYGDGDAGNKSQITKIQFPVENVEPRLRSVLHKVSSTIDRC